MAAGDGARRQARAVARRLESGSARDVQAARRQLHAWSRGAEGEALVAATVEALTPSGWRALHDLPWPGRPRANIDHLLVGPGGIVVIDAKYWTQPVTIRDGRLSSGTRRRAPACESVVTQVAAISALCDPPLRRHVRGALCFVGQPIGPAVAGGVTVVGLDQLVAWLADLPPVLSPAEIDRTANRLDYRVMTAREELVEQARERRAVRQEARRVARAEQRRSTRGAGRPRARPNGRRPARSTRSRGSGSRRPSPARRLLGGVLVIGMALTAPAWAPSVMSTAWQLLSTR